MHRVIISVHISYIADNAGILESLHNGLPSDSATIRTTHVTGSPPLWPLSQAQVQLSAIMAKGTQDIMSDIRLKDTLHHTRIMLVA